MKFPKESSTRRDAPTTVTEWRQWIQVANGALAEVGAEPRWDLDNGWGAATSGTDRAHYRSALLADLSLGFDKRPHRNRPDLPPESCVCWPCWASYDGYTTCEGVAYTAALVFHPCHRAERVGT